MHALGLELKARTYVQPRSVHLHLQSSGLLMPSGLPGAGAANPEFVIELSLTNACITFFDDRHTRFRSSLVSLEGREAMVHGFSEYQFGYQRLTTVRVAQPRDEVQLKQCRRIPLGIGVPYSCNNVFHQVTAIAFSECVVAILL